MVRCSLSKFQKIAKIYCKCVKYKSSVKCAIKWITGKQYGHNKGLKQHFAVYTSILWKFSNRNGTMVEIGKKVLLKDKNSNKKY